MVTGSAPHVSKMLEALDMYARLGVPTGDFLRACLENDFISAVLRADDENVLHLPEIARYIYNELPGACHGSRDKVERWITKKGAAHE